MIKKIIVTGDRARKKILQGVETVGDAVGSTLGPHGRNAIIYRKYKSPLITNDGVTIARHTFLEDEIEDLGAQTIVEIAMKTNDQAGDGTTTSVVIATALIKKCFKDMNDSILGGQSNAMKMYRDINTAKNKVISALKEASSPVKKDDVKKIVSTSLENLEYGKIISEMIDTVGKEGYISVEDNWATQYGISSEVILGMKKVGSYASPYLITNTRKEAVIEDAHILVTNYPMESVASLKGILEGLRTAGKMKLVIISGANIPFSKAFIAKVVDSSLKAKTDNPEAFQILAIKAPALTSQELGDVAVFCNAKFVDENADIRLKDITVDDLGFAKKTVVTEDDFVMTGGRGKTDDRVKMLNQEIEMEKDTMFKEKLKRRVSSLTSGIGIIRVGAMTETERGYLKLKIEDAVNAAKAAIEEGTVKGGGLALKEIAESLGKDNILYEAIMAPYLKIQENAGGKLEIAKDIIDPVKVTRLAVENACSAAGILITTETAISERKRSMWDELEKRISNRDDSDDFRDDENQDLGSGKLVE